MGRPGQAPPPAVAQQGSAGPGLFGQMASTAAYVFPLAISLLACISGLLSAANWELVLQKCGKQGQIPQ
jgi:hypothetical protein